METEKRGLLFHHAFHHNFSNKSGRYFTLTESTFFEVLHATIHRKHWLGNSEALLLFLMANILLPACIQLTLDELVCYYHHVRPRFKHKEILSIIVSHHRVRIAYSTIKPIWKREVLNREKNATDRELKNIFRNELNTSLSLAGYRQMTEWITLKYNI